MTSLPYILGGFLPTMNTNPIYLECTIPVSPKYIPLRCRQYLRVPFLDLLQNRLRILHLIAPFPCSTCPVLTMSCFEMAIEVLYIVDTIRISRVCSGSRNGGLRGVYVFFGIAAVVGPSRGTIHPAGDSIPVASSARRFEDLHKGGDASGDDTQRRLDNSKYFTQSRVILSGLAHRPNL